MCVLVVSGEYVSAYPSRRSGMRVLTEAYGATSLCSSIDAMDGQVPSPTILRTPYAMSTRAAGGTVEGGAAGSDRRRARTVLRTPYAISGTDVRYADGSRSYAVPGTDIRQTMRCPVLTYPIPLASYAICGTEIGQVETLWQLPQRLEEQRKDGIPSLPPVQIYPLSATRCPGIGVAGKRRDQSLLCRGGGRGERRERRREREREEQLRLASRLGRSVCYLPTRITVAMLELVRVSSYQGLYWSVYPPGHGSACTHDATVCWYQFAYQNGNASTDTRMIIAMLVVL
eukprot:1927292-Rhodomonas_salina.1